MAADLLLNPFENDYPDHLAYGVADFPESNAGAATCAAFGALRGEYQAFGSDDGTVYIWDCLARNVARTIRGAHTDEVTSASWSKHLRLPKSESNKDDDDIGYLVTGSLDGTVAVHRMRKCSAFEPEKPCTEALFRFKRPILSIDACGSGDGSFRILVTMNDTVNIGLASGAGKGMKLSAKRDFDLHSMWPVLITLSSDARKVISADLFDESVMGKMHSSIVDAGKALVRGRFSPCGNFVVLAVPGNSVLSIRVSFANGPCPDLAVSGMFAYAGSSKQPRIRKKSKISNDNLSSPDHGEVFFSGNGKLCVVREHSSRKHLHVLSVSQHEESGELFFKPIQALQDAVNGTRWGTCCFSGDGEYLAASSMDEATHTIYVWTAPTKSTHARLATVLRPSSPNRNGKGWRILDISWHPKRPVIASVAYNGHMLVWAKSYSENWSAFAPNFTPIDFNEEYEEKEDEFDVMDEEEGSCQNGDDDDDDDGIIDVCG